MTDIVERLRRWRQLGRFGTVVDDLDAAANEIERLRKAVADIAAPDRKGGAS